MCGRRESGWTRPATGWGCCGWRGRSTHSAMCAATAPRRSPGLNVAYRGHQTHQRQCAFLPWPVLVATSNGRATTRARVLVEAQLVLDRELGDIGEEVCALHMLGVIALNQEDYDRATPLFERALTDFQRLGTDGGIYYTRYALGIIAYARGDFTTATSLLEAAIAWRRDLGYVVNLAVTLNALGLINCEQGDYAAASGRLAESFSLWQQDRVGNREVFAELLAAVARLTACRGQHDIAARLYGAAEALTDVAGVPLVVPPRFLYRRHVEALRASLGEDAFATAWAAGRAWSLEQAMEEVRADTAEPVAAAETLPDPVPVPGSLTPRQRDVLRLVAEGRTDREIAAALFIGERTVEWHLTNAFTTLGVGTRAAAASAAIRLGQI